jgi:hypothetical protein
MGLSGGDGGEGLKQLEPKAGILGALALEFGLVPKAKQFIEAEP